MTSGSEHLQQVEGQWEELILHPQQFIGRRVRVTVLPEDKIAGETLRSEVRRWLAEADALNMDRQLRPPNSFEDGLVEKFSKQGLVL